MTWLDLIVHTNIWICKTAVQIQNTLVGSIVSNKNVELTFSGILYKNIAICITNNLYNSRAGPNSAFKHQHIETSLLTNLFFSYIWSLFQIRTKPSLAVALCFFLKSIIPFWRQIIGYSNSRETDFHLNGCCWFQIKIDRIVQMTKYNKKGLTVSAIIAVECST